MKIKAKDLVYNKRNWKKISNNLIILTQSKNLLHLSHQKEILLQN